MKKLYVLCGLALWVAIVVFSPTKKSGENEAVPAVHRSSKVLRSGQEVVSREKAAPAVDPVRRDDAQAAIDAAVVTYEPSGVKAILPFLLDPDPQIRQAARDGMVQLGESDAIPLLRDAASKLDDPQEVASLQDAADLLSLPAWSETEEAREVVAEIAGDSSSR